MFVLKNVENVKESSKNMYVSIKETIGDKYSHLKENVDHIIKYEDDEENGLIVIRISKKHLKTTKLRKILASIYEQVSIVKFKENANFLFEKTKETTVVVKENLIEKYRKFLTWYLTFLATVVSLSEHNNGMYVDKFWRN